MNNEFQLEWVDKYCPKTLDDYVLENETKDYLKSLVKNKTLTSMSFVGQQGSGKTTLAKVLCNELNAEVLFVKCATEGVIDTLRTKVEPFCNALSMEGRPKVCILDELDSAASSGQNNFQMALRTLIEAAQSDCRFIITCNYVEKILPAVLSRCPVIPLSYSKKELLIHIKKILDLEKIVYDKDSLKAFVEESFKYYPDCRRIIKYLQICCADNTLKVKLNTIINSAKDDFIKELVTKTVESNNILDVRSFYLKNKDKIGDYVTFASDVFNYVIDNDIVNTEIGILNLTDILYKLNVVVDKESMFFGLLTQIKQMHS